MAEDETDNRQLEYTLARRATYLKIYLDRILDNLSVLKTRLAPHTMLNLYNGPQQRFPPYNNTYNCCPNNNAPDKKIIAVLKSNAYGHGSVPVARCLQAHGYNHAAVATLQEGEELRNGGFSGFIQVFGNAEVEEIPSLYKNQLTPTVAEVKFLSEWAKYARNQGIMPEAIVIKIDTGLTRFGCLPCELSDLVETCECNDIPIHSMMTHFARSFNDPDFTQTQLNLFLNTVKPYRDRGIKLQAANSGAILMSFGTDLDFVRPGLAMYGQAREEFGLKPAIEWFARASLVKQCKTNQTVGYGKNYRCPSPETIAIVPIGHADGYSTQNYNKGILTTPNGINCPVVGRIGMDAITIKMPNNAESTREFCVMSADFNEVNSCFALSKNTGALRSELLSNLRKRLPRIYVLSGSITLSV